jgi:putative effector of murein hydrolase
MNTLDLEAHFGCNGIFGNATRPILCSMIVLASVSGLFGAAALTRLFGLAKEIASFSLLSRHIASALAMVTGSILGPDVSLSASIAILGWWSLGRQLFGASILEFWRIKCPVARGGMAIGAASHGLGTAAISHEKDTFPFAAIAMTLVASFSVVLEYYSDQPRRPRLPILQHPELEY